MTILKLFTDGWPSACIQCIFSFRSGEVAKQSKLTWCYNCSNLSKISNSYSSSTTTTKSKGLLLSVSWRSQAKTTALCSIVFETPSRRSEIGAPELQRATSVSLKPFSGRYILLRRLKEDHSSTFRPQLHFHNIIINSSTRAMSGQAELEKDMESNKFNQRFLDCAARGDLDDLKTLFGSVDIDVKSERGWTALMFAARNGHTTIISALIEKGCDVNSLNSSGQTAFDIAEFWNHKQAASLLSQHRQDEQYGQIHNYFALNPLYRASDLRKDSEYLQAAKRNPSSKYILFSNLQPFLLQSEGPKRKYKFALFSCDQLPSSVIDKSGVVFLGLETWDPDSNAWFAIDLGNEATDLAKMVHPNGNFVVPFPATMQMESIHAGIFAEAHSILNWLDRYKHCPTCGSKQSVIEGGYKQVCTKTDCSSHKGVHNTCYPRVDPSLIMLVVSTDKQHCLLGRQKRFPPKMYSCLAGFMEPGECIEDTCRREVQEESGVKVGKVEYHSSQPWPFPASLMLGCVAHASTDNIQVNKEELEDARWFTRSETALMLAQQHPDGLFVPPKQAIAHQLIKAWISSSHSNL